MLTVDKYARIRQAHRDGMSIREIARTFHHSRRKVREVLASPEPKPFTRPDRPMVFHIVCRIQPKNRSRVVSKEDVLQGVLIAVAQELKGQGELRTLNQRLGEEEKVELTQGTRKRLLRFFTKAKNRTASKEADLPSELRLAKLRSRFPDNDEDISETTVKQWLAEIEAESVSLAALVNFVVDTTTFKTGDDIKTWLCAVTSNKAYDALQVNLREEGPSACAGIDRNGERQDRPCSR